MSELKLLSQFDISAIGSAVRDLSIISDDPAALEASILARQMPLAREHFKPLKVRSNTGEKLQIGDVVLFSSRLEGAYTELQVATGKNVAMTQHGVYLGVLCERGSSKEFSGKFLTPPCLSQDLDLQLLCESGGIGFATGFSRTLAKTNPSGVAGDVVILGVVVDGVTDRPLNTVSAMMPSLFETLEFDTPLVFIGGSGPSVGKTTTTAALLGALADDVICSAVKAAGTGDLEDSEAHLNNGAEYIVHSMDVGMPTTYIDPGIYKAGIREMLAYAADPNLVPDGLRQRHHRGRELAKPNLILAELGGDLSEANIPVLLSDHQLKKHVAAYIVCTEGASSLAGALQELEETGIRNSPQTPIYAATPWGNVEGMYSRMKSFADRGLIAGIFDVAKPDFGDDQRAWRLNYTVHHEDIMSVSDLAAQIRQNLGNSENRQRPDC